MTVLLPTGEKAALDRTERSPSEESWTGSGVVLLVDDEEVVRSVAAAMLRRLGFEVLEAEDGRHGLEVFRRHADEIAFVVLELAMPNMSGDEVFQEMRQIKSDARVLLSSGFDEQDVSNRFAASGLAGFIHNPYRLDTLRRAVRQILDS